MNTVGGIKSIFASAPLNPPDSIFGLIEQFKKDPNPARINLSVGVYQDDSGKTPVMECVRAAEQAMLDADQTKNYLPIDGGPAYNQLTGHLVLGESLAGNPDIHWATAQTPGGTVALRIAGDVLLRVLNVDTIWMSNPTWANHPQIYSAAGFNIEQYDYLDANKTGFDFGALLDSLKRATPNQAILLHTVCHNPTGVDPSPEQWRQLSDLIRNQQLIPVFDFAYQGFGEDIESDAFPIRYFVESGGEAIVCNSFSKNFGLYAERVGGISVVTASRDAAAAMLSQIKSIIRTMYSNPPLHGGKIIETVLGDADRRANWKSELAVIRNRIRDLRATFVATMQELAPNHNFQYINQQRGMFSYSGLKPEQVKRLREEHSIYILGSGRINVAGINNDNLQRLCQAIASVL